jgi:signal transduction histidine kinase
MAGTVWLVVALAASFSFAASMWVGSIARNDILQQHVRRLSLETDQLGSDLSQAVASRLDAVRAAGQILRDADPADRQSELRGVFDELQSAYPELDWIALADSAGTLVASGRNAAAAGKLAAGGMTAAGPWFVQGLRGPWIGVIDALRNREQAPPAPRGNSPTFGELTAPVRDARGAVIGVIAAHLSWHWAPNHLPRLSEAVDPRDAAQALVLNREDLVLVGPQELLGRRWNGVALDVPAPVESEAATRSRGDISGAPRFERLPDGRTVLVARAPVSSANGSGPGWQVQLSEPNEHVYQRANALGVRILWISLGLGIVTALAGALGARHLTNRLKRLTHSAAAVGRNDSSRIEVPRGHDEVAQLATAFAKILDDLQRERSDLLALSGDLERRVAVRTREVERLAEESRYAAIVRERLKIARDLHDTLAHSMMAMLSEVRLLRRLQAHDPGSLADELVRAEQVAHEGLIEARTAITQMRVNAVRDTGLGAALAKAFERFIDHTGLTGEFDTDADAARFGDERAETIFRMAEEALRNIERHAMARHVVVTLTAGGGTHLELRIKDDGVGFDPQASHPGHYGLVGLREQAQLIGADLQIQSTRGAGTTLWVSLRIAPEVL